MKKLTNNRPEVEKVLLICHKRHLGVYQRVARDLGVHPSYVSRVANGARRSEKIKRAILTELARIQSYQQASMNRHK
jgi:DNA-binding transcriptional regulator YdaS (Cro superfamily)